MWIYWQTLLDGQSLRQRDSTFRPSKVWQSDHYATGTLPLKHFALPLYYSFPWLQRAGCILGYSCKKSFFQALKKCFFYTALMTLKQARLCKKTTFQALKNCFFSALLLWNSGKPGFAKNNFSGSKNLFFRMPLVKSANSTSLPRLSSFKLAPNCEDACNT